MSLVTEVRMDSVATTALGELIATAIAAVAGRSWQAIRSSPEAVAVKDAVDRALVAAFLDACRDTVTADDDWIGAVAGVWKPTFTPAVSRALVGSLANPGGDEFAAVAVQALHDSGCDLVELGRTFWVEQFLCVLPRLLFKELEEAALGSDSTVRTLVGHLLGQRGEARAARGETEATPREFGEDVLLLLRRLDTAARTRRLPPYLPHGADVSKLARPVWVRRGVRASSHLREPVQTEAGSEYRLPAERAQVSTDSEPARPWTEMAASHRRLVVLADPGLGKSWLIRAETQRLCEQALAATDAGVEPRALLIPVPLRCDELAATDGQDIAEVVATFVVAQKLMPARSQVGLQSLVEAGRIVLLLDALDELATDEQYGRVKELLNAWYEQAGDAVRCVVTSRIAGYRGSPLPDATEVELQAFTREDVSQAVASWALQQQAASRVLDRLKDPAVASMTRVPLLLALLCSLATELPAGEQLPTTRKDLYDRIMRWFLTGAHRAGEEPSRVELPAEEVDALLEILAPVAFHFASLPTGWTDLMVSAELRNAIRAAGPAFTERDQPASDLVQKLSVSAGILVPAGNLSAGRHPSYLFFHRTFAEYLVARHLATLPMADWLEVVDQHMWFDPDWAEVFPLLGAQLGPEGARELAQHLLSQANDPFHHALLAAIRVLTEQPDPDRLLPSEDLWKITAAIRTLITHPATSRTTVNVLAAAGRLPTLMIDDLLVLLNDQSRVGWEPVSLTALKVLEGRDAPGLTERLLTLLADGDLQVQKRAAEALARRDAPELTDRLLALLSDSRSSVQEAAAMALAGRDAPEVTDRLLALLDDESTAVQVAAVNALAGRDAPEVTGQLLAVLDDESWVLQESAVKALAGRDAPGLTDRLLALLDHPMSLALTAAGTLAQRNEPEFTALLLALLDKDTPVRSDVVVEALAEQNRPEVTDRLLALLRNKDWQMRLAAVDALAARDKPEVTDRLLALRDDPTPVVAGTAVRALAKRDAPGLTEQLLALLADRNSSTRSAAVDALAGRDLPRLTEQLLALLDDQDLDVRWAAARALGGRDAPEVTDRLLALLNDPNWSTRRTAVEALARRDTREVTRRLLALLNDEYPPVREAVVEALARRNTPEAIDGLLAAFGDESEIVRILARQALEGRTAQGLTDRLLALLNDPRRQVRRAAAEALMSRSDTHGLLALAGRVQALNPAAMGLAYRIAQQMVSEVYLLLPMKSRTRVRTDFASLTTAVMASQDLDYVDGISRLLRADRTPVVGCLRHSPGPELAQFRATAAAPRPFSSPARHRHEPSRYARYPATPARGVHDLHRHGTRRCLDLRTYGTRQLYGPGLVRTFSSREPRTCRSQRRVRPEPRNVSQLR